MPKLKARYDDIDVLRNDEQSTRFKLSAFGGVRVVRPDFNFIRTAQSGRQYVQVFFESEGGGPLRER
uniref:hypothetical protein n=1 Tax=Salmonella enterica TaxID=28901 RepID=UPI00398C5F09